jgi:hypothetical protein
MAVMLGASAALNDVGIGQDGVDQLQILPSRSRIKSGIAPHRFTA